MIFSNLLTCNSDHFSLTKVIPSKKSIFWKMFKLKTKYLFFPIPYRLYHFSPHQICSFRILRICFYPETSRNKSRAGNNWCRLSIFLNFEFFSKIFTVLIWLFVICNGVFQNYDQKTETHPDFAKISKKNAREEINILKHWRIKK